MWFHFLFSTWFKKRILSKKIISLKVKVIVAQLCPILCPPMEYSLPGSSLHGLGKNTGVGSHSLLQGIFPTQESNPDLLHCRQILHHLSHQGSPVISQKINIIVTSIRNSTYCFLHYLGGRCIRKILVYFFVT